MAEAQHKLTFLKGAEDFLAMKSSVDADFPSQRALIRSQMEEVFNVRNLSFLLGAGASSYMQQGVQVGIPTMLPLAKEFLDKANLGKAGFPSLEDRTFLKETYGIDLADEGFTSNLEHLMEVLFATRFVLQATSANMQEGSAKAVLSVAQQVSAFLLDKCTNGEFAHGNDAVISLYQRFYRKLMLRERGLPRPWVFTTNYDLFSEVAMDRLGMHYCNGFSGSVERRFNPSLFRYALAEQLDISSRKWSAVDGFIYLAKLHGSVNWVEDGEGLFPLKELQSTQIGGNVMIYPTPAKQRSSLASPYADLFREFQAQITQNQSVLVTIGYSFSDEHINNLIYRALTIPTFRLIIIATTETSAEILKLSQLQDPRIWIFGGQLPDGSAAHYFSNFVDEFLPSLPGERVENAVQRIIETMRESRVEPEITTGGAK